MNKFKSAVIATSVVIAICLGVMSQAQAGNNNANPCGNNGNNCNTSTTVPTTNNNTANGGAGGDALSIAGASSVAEAKANAAAIAAQQQAQQQGQAQGQQQSSTSEVKNSGNSSSNVTGSGNSANNNKSQASGNSTAVTVGGTIVERSAPAVFAGNIPSVPTSCRLYMFGGGTNVNGAVSGSVPLGNDQTCLSGTNVNGMFRTNEKFPGTYPVSDIVREQCKVEGMQDTDTCKNLK